MFRSRKAQVENRAQHQVRGGFFGTRISNFDHRSLKSKSAGEIRRLKLDEANSCAHYRSILHPKDSGFVF